MKLENQDHLWPDTQIAPVRSAAVGSFGERMQRERELRSISLDEIANSTKIGTRMLHALETEDFDKLPGGIFNKGFVRAYARYLGLDEEQAVTDYLASEAEKDRKNRQAPLPEQSQLFVVAQTGRGDNLHFIRSNAVVEEQGPPDSGGFLMAAVVLVFVLGIGGFAWKYISQWRAKSIKGSNVTRQTARPLKATQPPSQPVRSETLAAQPFPPAPDSKNSPELSGSSGANITPKIASIAEPVAQAKLSTLSDQPLSFNLDIKANDESWVQVTSDGKLWEGTLASGSTKSFHASKDLVVKLGNAGAVELSYNGKPLPKYPPETKTKTITFTSDGPH